MAVTRDLTISEENFEYLLNELTESVCEIHDRLCLFPTKNLEMKLKIRKEKLLNIMAALDPSIKTINHDDRVFNR